MGRRGTPSGCGPRMSGESTGRNSAFSKARRMGKTDLMAHFVEHFAARGLTLRRADAREFLEELHRLCVQQLNDTGEFMLPRMGKFVLRQRATRTGRNPRTGEPIQIQARKVVTVRVARQLKESLSK